MSSQSENVATQNARLLLDVIVGPLRNRHGLRAANLVVEALQGGLTKDALDDALPKAIEQGWIEESRTHFFRLTEAGQQEVARKSGELAV